MDELTNFVARNGFLPHGYCFQWAPSLLWGMVVADVAIALAYFSIPLAIVHAARRRPDINRHGLAWLFGAFIFSCGLTHVMDVWTIWQPDYDVQVISKLATAIISVITAAVVWRVMPAALSLPSTQTLQRAVNALQAEVNRRISAEDNLQEVEQSLSATLASIEAGFITTDAQGRVKRLNEVAERMTQWRSDEALGISVWDVVQREGRPEDYTLRNPIDVIQELSAGEPIRKSVVCVGRLGARTPVDLHAELTKRQDGTIQGITMVLRDMARLTSAQEEIRRLASVVESSSDAIVVKDLAGIVTDWNPSAQAMFGYTASDMVGQPILKLVPTSLIEEEQSVLDRLRKGQHIPPFRTWRLNKSGGLIEVSVQVSPLRDISGRIIGGIKAARDMTATRQAEFAKEKSAWLEAENKRVQESSRLKSLFLANMSHELRTPLNAVIGFSDILQRGMVSPDSPKYAQYLAYISNSGRHLLEMINDVLDLSKIEAGKLTFHPVVTLLPPLFDEVLQTLDVQARENQLAIHVQIDARLNEVCIDPTRLKQVLFNFLSNAVKFTGKGGRIDIRATTEGDHLWRLEVQDTGCGIPPAQLSKLFVEFQQLDAGLDKKHQGTGLGLALTRRLVEAQMGRVGVHSQPGHGSCFYAVLPRQHGQAHQMDQHASRVLLAWNDPHVLDALTKALVKAGIPHDPTEGAQEMAQLGQSRTYEAITLDLSQQDAPGLHALASIRASHGESSQAAVKAIGYSCQTGVSVAFPVANVLFKPLQRDMAWSSTWRRLLQPAMGAKVLVVDDDPAAGEMMQVALREVGLVTVSVQHGQNILETLDSVQPMAMVLDLMMPGVSGFQVLDAIRQSPKWSGLPIIVWTAMTLSMEEQWVLSQAAQAIASKGDLDTIATVRDALLQWFLNQPKHLTGSEIA